MIFYQRSLTAPFYTTLSIMMTSNTGINQFLWRSRVRTKIIITMGIVFHTYLYMYYTVFASVRLLKLSQRTNIKSRSQCMSYLCHEISRYGLFHLKDHVEVIVETSIYLRSSFSKYLKMSVFFVSPCSKRE